MKGFFLFYIALIIIVFCIFNTTNSNTNVFVSSKQEEYTVNITGAVEVEGDYTVAIDTYLFEVLKYACLASNADLSNINIYKFVSDKEKIFIPYGIININTASVKELDYLDGVGEATALKIIAYRESTPFTTIEDLNNVSATAYKNNSHRITV